MGQRVATTATRLKTWRRAIFPREAAPRAPSLLEFYQLPFDDTAAAPTVSRQIAGPPPPAGSSTHT